MHTTAHPDDEDNGLLAMLGHGQGMRTVLVSATRGDGGQNEIGPELFQALSMLRTEELLAAHRFDGAEQYFTRAVDFGFSFSVEETLRQWGHDEILGDFVRHIRAIRPDVIAGFLCDGAGGGQHHQASALLTREAFRAAADPRKYPEHISQGLPPWQARRVFCTDMSSFGPGTGSRASASDVLRVSTNVFDPLLGRTFFELGIEARSMHKCQGTSQLLPLPGAELARVYRLQDSGAGGAAMAPLALFEGIDTSIPGLAGFAGSAPPPELTQALDRLAASVGAAQRAVDAAGQAAAVAPLAAGVTEIRRLRSLLSRAQLTEDARFEIDLRLATKEQQFAEALALTHALRLEVLADDGLVIGGQPVRISVSGTQQGPGDLMVKRVTLAGLEGAAPQCATTVKPHGGVTCAADLRVADVPLSSAYWQRRPDAARYDFDPDVPFGVPFRPSPFRAEIDLVIGGVDVRLNRVVQYRYDDVIAGEKRMELKVVPPFAVAVAPDIAVVPAGSGRVRSNGGAGQETGRSRRVEVRVTSHQKQPARGELSLQIPSGWTVTPAAVSLEFAREDEPLTRTFTITPPPNAPAGEYVVKASVADTEGDTFSVGYDVIEYPHVHRRHLIRPAQGRLKIIDVTVPEGLKVGYVMGVGDQVPQAIEQLGASIEMIGPNELAAGDLTRYDVIVTGVRAYERRPDLRASNQRLLDYVVAGGTVLVQYNKFEFNQAQYGPYPVKVSANRVTDETAPVEVLHPDHPVFTAPNRIGPDAWTGWVQERGLYFLGEKDPRYVDLIRLADPFEYNTGPRSGALVEARVGKGRWIYIGLGLWRQLPAGTDGAYRLMANLLSLGRSR
jgi:LmbE family N-acetylglucosaminyl deacetylase